jgi:hypothetical protein
MHIIFLWERILRKCWLESSTIRWEDNIKIDIRRHVVRMDINGTGSGSCPVVSFDTSGVRYSGVPGIRTRSGDRTSSLRFTSLLSPSDTILGEYFKIIHVFHILSS